MNALSRTVSSHLLSALVAAISHAHTLEALVRPLLELLQTATGLESTCLARVDEAEGMLQILYARNSHRLTLPEGLRVPWEGSHGGQLYPDDAGDGWEDGEVARSLGVVTYLSTPVRGRGGELFGSLCAASAERKPLPESANQVLALFAQLISQQMERERLLADLQKASDAQAAMLLTDAVTQLPNRRAALEEMQRRLAGAQDDRALILAFIDLDGFKPINERFGYEIGDQFLQTMAKRLRRMLRDSDMAARMGGDEFAVLAVEQRAKAKEAAAALSRRLQSATQGRFKLDAVLLDYDGASVAAVVAQPDCAGAQALLGEAEAAMAAVKQARKLRAASPPAATGTVARFQWPVIE